MKCSHMADGARSTTVHTRWGNGGPIKGRAQDGNGDLSLGVGGVRGHTSMAAQSLVALAGVTQTLVLIRAVRKTAMAALVLALEAYLATPVWRRKASLRSLASRRPSFSLRYALSTPSCTKTGMAGRRDVSNL
jgi:hypothetical protein